ncbi:MAG TPA: hypothetical protein VGI50_01050 [Solirubrobacteraceae bacterium]
MFGLLGAVRALRGEEDTGRAELVLAGVVSRRVRYLASTGAVFLGTFLLWLAQFLGLVVGGLPAGGSARLGRGTPPVPRSNARRDLDVGLLASHGATEPDLRLLSSPTAHALRAERTSLIVWTASARRLASPSSSSRSWRS